MASSTLLPLHQKKNTAFSHSGPSKTILRLTEKYVLAIALVAFSLVFFGAFFLPQDQVVKRKLRDIDLQMQPQVHDPHQHNIEGDHRNAERSRFNLRAQNDADIKNAINTMEEQLLSNDKNIDILNSRLKSLVESKNKKEQGDKNQDQKVNDYGDAKTKSESGKDNQHGKGKRKSFILYL